MSLADGEAMSDKAMLIAGGEIEWHAVVVIDAGVVKRAFLQGREIDVACFVLALSYRLVRAGGGISWKEYTG